MLERQDKSEFAFISMRIFNFLSFKLFDVKSRKLKGFVNLICFNFVAYIYYWRFALCISMSDIYLVDESVHNA